MKKREEIIKLLALIPYPVLTYTEFELIFFEIKKLWGYKTKSKLQVIEVLEREKLLKEDASSSIMTFYIKMGENVDVLDIAAARSRMGYFCFYTALSIHGLTNQIPKQIYLSRERRYIAHTDIEISQEAINKAFSKEPRINSNILKYKSYKINLLHGQGQNNLGVIPYRKIYKVSNLERTLIDASVRPFYCGGVTQVLEAFRAAYNILDIKLLYKYYTKMNFIYPYNNIIGFYLENSGHSKDETLVFKNLGGDFTIYLTYNMKNIAYSKDWNIHYPVGLI